MTKKRGKIIPAESQETKREGMFGSENKRALSTDTKVIFSILSVSSNPSLCFLPLCEIRSQLFSFLFGLRVHEAPSVNVPPPPPKTGKDFPSNINPITAY